MDHDGSRATCLLERENSVDNVYDSHQVEHDAMLIPVDDLELRDSVCLARLGEVRGEEKCVCYVIVNGIMVEVVVMD